MNRPHEHDIQHRDLDADLPRRTHGRDGAYPVPGKRDISDSAHWSNKADVGIVVHCPGLIGDDETIIRVAKSCYHTAIGKPGEVTVV